MFLWLLTLYLKVEPMAPFLFLHHYMDATCIFPKKQPKFPKMHFAVAFSGKRIGKSFEKSNPNPPKCILRLLFREMPGHREKSSAGGMVNAAGSERGLPMHGLSNRLLHPPASNGVCGRI